MVLSFRLVYETKHVQLCESFVSFSGSLVRDKASSMPVKRGMACFEVTTE